MPSAAVAIFDLDGTLYPGGGRLTRLIDAAVAQLFSAAGVDAARLAQLEAAVPSVLDALDLVGIERARFYEAVFADLPWDECVEADPPLVASVAGLPVSAFVVSVAPQHHIERVLGALGLLGSVDGVLSMEHVAGTSKETLYREVLGRTGVPPSAVVVVGDDVAVDLVPARLLGCAMIHVASEPHHCGFTDVGSVHDAVTLLRAAPSARGLRRR